MAASWLSVVHVRDEGAVDLDLVDREPREVGERRVADAEVVDRDRRRRGRCSCWTTAFVRSGSEAIVLSVISSGEAVARDARTCAGAVAIWSGSVRSCRLRIERFTATLTIWPVAPPSACTGRAPPRGRTAVSGSISAVRSAAGMNSVGPDQAARGMLPAHERLDAGELAGLRVDLGLVVEHELALARSRAAARRAASGWRVS